MPPAIPANVTPRLLEWAREQSGLPIEAVAKWLQVDAAKVKAWEHAEGKPTVRQTMSLAKLFRRPFGLFFLPEPPVVAPLAAEYRRLPGVKPGAESPEFRLAVRVMVERRELALELGPDAFPSFDLAARMSDGAITVSERIRAALGVSLETQTAWPDEWAAWRHWRGAVENIGALVFQFPKVPLTEIRGTALLHFPSPAIGINSKESAPGARVFTLMHELVHVVLARGRDEDVALREPRSEQAWLEVERFAEETASQILIPALGVDGAKKFLRRGNKGIATPVAQTLARAGRPLTQLVLEALDSNRITAVDASRFLDLRFDHFEALRAELAGKSAAAA